jgi:hypothetical protein
MVNHRIVRAIPNEKWQLILEFPGAEYRLFELSELIKGKGWKKLASPQYAKLFTASPDGVVWPDAGRVDAEDLYKMSVPVGSRILEYQTLRVSAKNQAPTSEDKYHHVFGVYLAPFSSKPFRIGESIGGGHAERGGWHDLTLSELLARPAWKKHFQLAGCMWAISIIESMESDPERLIESLVCESSERNGLPA